jgi:glutathione S-transferase
MITITAMKWAPPFAAGQVRDHRARWILNEVGWPYRVRLVDAPTLKSSAYLRSQPFGQVPYLEEDGRPTLFETGAIVIDVATRAGKLIPADGPERALVISWVIAALNSIEPFLMNIAEIE